MNDDEPDTCRDVDDTWAWGSNFSALQSCNFEITWPTSERIFALRWRRMANRKFSGEKNRKEHFADSCPDKFGQIVGCWLWSSVESLTSMMQARQQAPTCQCKIITYDSVRWCRRQTKIKSSLCALLMLLTTLSTGNELWRRTEIMEMKMTRWLENATLALWPD